MQPWFRARHPAAGAAGRTCAGCTEPRLFHAVGSDTVDRTTRCARCYWHAKGQRQRDQFIAVLNGYHGWSTVAPGFHTGATLDWQHKIALHCACRKPVGTDPAEIIAASVAELRAKIEQIGPERAVTFHDQPIQRFGGVLVPHSGWVAAIHAVCREYGVLFVADKVITGFGHTGPMSACLNKGIVPDMMTTAKGLTSDYMPMGAVFVSDGIYQTIADSAAAVGTAVGLAVLDLYKRGLLENGLRKIAGRAARPDRSAAGRRCARARNAGGGRTGDRQDEKDTAADTDATCGATVRPGSGQWADCAGLCPGRAGLCAPTLPRRGRDRPDRQSRKRTAGPDAGRPQGARPSPARLWPARTWPAHLWVGHIWRCLIPGCGRCFQICAAPFAQARSAPARFAQDRVAQAGGCAVRECGAHRPP